MLNFKMYFLLIACNCICRKVSNIFVNCVSSLRDRLVCSSQAFNSNSITHNRVYYLVQFSLYDFLLVSSEVASSKAHE